jgi:hypothetical protein
VADYLLYQFILICHKTKLNIKNKKSKLWNRPLGAMTSLTLHFAF